MENNLTSIAYARPIIYAEGLFASCYLDQGEFVPEEGISQTDLWNILSGELLKTGSDLVEDYALKSKLNRLRSVSKNTFELDQFPKDNIYTSSCEEQDMNTTSDNNTNNTTTSSNSGSNNSSSNEAERTRKEKLHLLNLRKLTTSTNDQDQFQLRKLSESEEFLRQISEESGEFHLTTKLTTSTEERSQHEAKLREVYEKQVSWIMGDEGDEFVAMETFSKFTDALILLDVLEKFNVPSVVSFLARRDEPIALTFSKTQIGLDCLMFCLFQA